MIDIVDKSDKPSANEVLRMAAEIVSAYVGNNELATSQIPDLIQSVYRSLNGLGNFHVSAGESNQSPATSIKKSITPDFLICLEDGKKLKMLKRHLRTVYKMTPQDYRTKWNLPPTIPWSRPTTPPSVRNSPNRSV